MRKTVRKLSLSLTALLLLSSCQEGGPSLLDKSSEEKKTFSMSFARADGYYDRQDATFRIKCSDDSSEVLSVKPDTTVSIECPDSSKIQMSYIIGSATWWDSDHYFKYFRTQEGTTFPGWSDEVFFVDFNPAVLEFDSSYAGKVIEFLVDWED